MEHNLNIILIITIRNVRSKTNQSIDFKLLLQEGKIIWVEIMIRLLSKFGFGKDNWRGNHRQNTKNLNTAKLLTKKKDQE